MTKSSQIPLDFFPFHALMLVNIAVTIWLKAVPQWEIRKRFSLPTLHLHIAAT